ncbi:MAG: glycosyltransferase family 2 protein, partial [Chloroflexota bacterium]
MPANPRAVNTVVIPAYNEEKGLGVLLEKLFQVVGDTYEVIVVDDGSTDGTPEVARQFACRLIRHEVNQGKGVSIQTGIQESRGEVVVWVDADDTYPVAVIPQMVANLRQSYDLVSAWRREGRQHMPWLNRL